MASSGMLCHVGLVRTTQRNIPEDAILLTLIKLRRTYCMEFHSKYINYPEIQIKSNIKTVASPIELKFLGLILQNTVFWKSHIGMLTSKLKHAIW
jgi:hypothetical protein